MGVLYHLRHPLLALDLIHEHVARRPAGFPVHAAWQPGRGRGRRRIMISGPPTAIFDEPGYPKLHFIEHSYSPTIPPTGGRRTGPASRRCCAARDLAILQPPDEEVYLCRTVPGPVRRPWPAVSAEVPQMIEAAKIWNEPNNKSHWDLQLDPGWENFRGNSDRRRAGDPRGSTAPAAGARRYLADRPLLHRKLLAQGRPRPRRCGGGARFPAGLESVADRPVAGQAQPKSNRSYRCRYGSPK